MLYNIPENPTGTHICLKLVGGLGDCIVALASAAKTLKDKYVCLVTLAVRDYQVDFFNHFEGVDFVISAKKLNSSQERGKYDVLIDLDNVFVSGREFKDAEYYKLVEERLGFNLELAKIKLPQLCKNKTIALHSGASNPNRAWPAEKWEDLGEELLARGFDLYWLGTREEPYINGHLEVDQSILATSRKIENKDFYFQTTLLAECSYFIGNDSGFCHVAGILDVPGSVIFSATKPEHVISRYKNLRAIVPQYFYPTRSINADDAKSLEYLQSLDVEDVLEATGLAKYPILSNNHYTKVPLSKKTLLLYGSRDYKEPLIERLSRGYLVSDVSNDSPVAEINLDTLTIKVEDKTVRVLNNIEAVIRTVKELVPD